MGCTTALGSEGIDDGELRADGGVVFDREPLEGLGFLLDEGVSLVEELFDGS